MRGELKRIIIRFPRAKHFRDFMISGEWMGRGRPPADTASVRNGELWILGTGAQWREMPNKYLPYQTCHRRFQQWICSGALGKALRKLVLQLRAEGRLNLEEAFIDAKFGAPHI